jgi:hypothetical protein
VLNRLSLELLQTSLHINAQGCELVIRRCQVCLISHFDILFYSDVLRGEFISLIGGMLSSKVPGLGIPINGASDIDGGIGIRRNSMSRGDIGGNRDQNKTVNDICESIDYMRYLRLFMGICSKYTNIDEVILVCQKNRSYYGLLIFQQLLILYSHLSIHSLEIKGLLDHSSDTYIALKELEQCNSNFVKCCIPFILSATTLFENSIGRLPVSYTTDLYIVDGGDGIGEGVFKFKFIYLCMYMHMKIYTYTLMCICIYIYTYIYGLYTYTGGIGLYSDMDRPETAPSQGIKSNLSFVRNRYSILGYSIIREIFGVGEKIFI